MKSRYQSRIGVPLVLLLLIFTVFQALGNTRADLPGQASGVYGGFDYAASADPDTALLLEGMFSNAKADDGKIMAGKSVSYGGDAYGVLSGYTDGMFGVTLSALSQGYYLEDSSGNKAPADVVFVLDFSGSMQSGMVSDGKGGTITRAGAMVRAVNTALATLNRDDADVRFGIVAFSGTTTQGSATASAVTSILLPLDRYDIAAGYTDYLTYGKQLQYQSVQAYDPLASVTIPSSGGTYYSITTSTYPRYWISSGGEIRYYTAYNTYVPVGTPAVGASVVHSTTGLRFVRTATTVEIQTPRMGQRTVTGSVTLPASGNTAFSANASFDNFQVNSSGRIQKKSTSGSSWSTIVTLNNGGVYTDSDFNVNFTRSGNTLQYQYTVTEPVMEKQVVETSGSGNIIYTSGLLTYRANGAAVPVAQKTVTGGTYTQAGVQYGANLLTGASDTASRIPALILLSDGDPTYASSSYMNVATSTIGNGGTGTADVMGQIGAYTVRTLAYQKERVASNYPDAQPLFYTLGPGVTELFGKTVLNPSAGNLALAAASETTTSARKLYDYLLAVNTNLSYADYANMSIAGDLQAAELEDIFLEIITQIASMQRPMDSSQPLPNTDKSVRFTDTLGASMKIAGSPAVRYGSTNYSSTGSSQATNADGSVTVTYRYNAQVTEPGTGMTQNLSNITVTVTTRTNGVQVVEWLLPAALVPMRSADENGVYTSVPPVSLVYQAAPAPGIGPGTYYTNNWDSAKTTVVYVPVTQNPYYYDDGAYIRPNISISKSENRTQTLEKSVASAFASGIVTLTLGNNGALKLTGTAHEVKKIWNDGGSAVRPASVTVRLYQNDTAYGSPVTLTGPLWSYRFEGLPKYTAAGQPAVYTVKETAVPSGYTVGYTTKNCITTITNSRSVQLTVKKLTQGKIPEDALFTFLITGKTPQGAEIYRSHAVLRSGQSETFSIPDGIYTVTELQNTGYRLIDVKLGTQTLTPVSPSVSFQTGTDTRFEVIFTNKYKPPGYFQKEHRVQNIFDPGK